MNKDLYQGNLISPLEELVTELPGFKFPEQLSQDQLISAAHFLATASLGANLKATSVGLASQPHCPLPHSLNVVLPNPRQLDLLRQLVEVAYQGLSAPLYQHLKV